MPGTITIDGNAILSLLSRDLGIGWFVTYRSRVGNNGGGCRSCSRNTRDQFTVFNEFKQALYQASEDDKLKVKKALGADRVRLIIRSTSGSGVSRLEF